MIAARLKKLTQAGFLGSLAVAAVVVAVGVSAIIDWNAKRAEAQIEQGQVVYGNACASCHGAKLEGQANWKSPKENGRLPAPPQDASGHTWHHADGVIFGIIKNGLQPYAGEDYESDMQPFAGILSDDEIAAVVAFIKSKWPEREKIYQAEITRLSEMTE